MLAPTPSRTFDSDHRWHSARWVNRCLYVLLLSSSALSCLAADPLPSAPSPATSAPDAAQSPHPYAAGAFQQQGHRQRHEQTEG
jgi:hypothetical protein